MHGRKRSKSINWPEANLDVKATSVPKTPVRKSDQWHRLAAVVKSTHKTVVPGSPQHCALSVIRSRGKLAKPITVCPNDSGNQQPYPNQGLSSSIAADVKNSPSKIRSLSSSFALVAVNHKEDDLTIRGDSNDLGGSGDPSNVLPQITESYFFKRKIKKNKSRVACSTERNCMKLFNPYSLQYLILVGFVLLISFIMWLIISELYSDISEQKSSVKRTLTAQDVSLLRKSFKEQLFGQHIAVKIICDLTEKLVENKLPEFSPQKVSSLDHSKMAVLSLHGWTGVGKTFTNKILVDSLNPERYIQFIVPIHFPHSSNDDIYKTAILQTVTSNVSRSALNVITFDEMDKASDSVLEGIANAIQQLKFGHSFVDSTVIVLLISNTHGRDLNHRLFQLLKRGYTRDKLTVSDFYNVFHDPLEDLTSGATQTFRWYKVFTERNLIDSFVPFLPLNHLHVAECVKRSLTIKGVNPTEHVVGRVFEDLSLFQPPGSLFQYSHTGCKRVSEKVDLHSEPW